MSQVLASASFNPFSIIPSERPDHFPAQMLLQCSSLNTDWNAISLTWHPRPSRIWAIWPPKLIFHCPLCSNSFIYMAILSLGLMNNSPKLCLPGMSFLSFPTIIVPLKCHLPWRPQLKLIFLTHILSCLVSYSGCVSLVSTIRKRMESYSSSMLLLIARNIICV